MLWPNSTSGAPGCSWRASSLRSRVSRTMAAQPPGRATPKRPCSAAVRPWPRWSLATIAYPASASTSATRPYRPACSDAPWAIWITARGEAGRPQRWPASSWPSWERNVKDSYMVAAVVSGGCCQLGAGLVAPAPLQ